MNLKISQEYLESKNSPNLAPWPHFTFPHFLEDEGFQLLQNRILSQKNQFITREDDPEKIQFAPLPDLIFARFLLSEEFKKFLEKTVGQKIELYKKGALQLRRMTSISPEFPPHYDEIDCRSLISLFYLAPNWSPEKGGELLLHLDEESDPYSAESKWIHPVENQLVLFFSDQTNWHSVRRVKNWTRLVVMSEWVIQ